MCGIAGFYSQSKDKRDLPTLLKSMTDALAHRGPDSEGFWLDRETGIALGHRRLSIIDLTDTGRQPMLSTSERYVIIFNGEIYNFLEIRAELESLPDPLHFRGTSDTEVLLAAIQHWGLEPALVRCVGMFAFALWDRKSRALTLCRDRMGEKPLYYGWMGTTLLFGSELKALRQHPDWRGEVDRDALTLLMRHGYIPAPYSIFKGIYKLPPATWLHLQHPHPGDLGEPQKYWDIKHVVETGAHQPYAGDSVAAQAELEQLLCDAVQHQMIADVPLGAFLSGGVDSSTIVALMQAQSNQPIRTFSIGYAEDHYNEAPFARAVAEHLGTDHTEMYVSSQDALNVIPQLPVLFDEPFADPSQIPTFLVATLARSHVTVSLSGDGGDELFAGYRHYYWTIGGVHQMHHIPIRVQAVAADLLRGLPASAWRAASSLADQLFSQRHRNPVQQLQRVIELLPISTPEDLFYKLVSRWRNPQDLVLGAVEPPTIFTTPERWANVPNPIQHMTFMDLEGFLPHDGLVKIDRASMGVSLESRLPLLDHRIIEFASRLPIDLKVRGGQTKWLLRQVLHRYVPAHLIDRPKSGFSLPIDVWLRADLRDWAEELLDHRRLEADGIFDTRLVHEVWQQHVRQERDWQAQLWSILMFQAWKETWL